MKKIEFPGMDLVRTGPNTFKPLNKDGSLFNWTAHFQKMLDEGELKKK